MKIIYSRLRRRFSLMRTEQSIANYSCDAYAAGGRPAALCAVLCLSAAVRKISIPRTIWSISCSAFTGAMHRWLSNSRHAVAADAARQESTVLRPLPTRRTRIPPRMPSAYHLLLTQGDWMAGRAAAATQIFRFAFASAGVSIVCTVHQQRRCPLPFFEAITASSILIPV